MTDWPGLPREKVDEIAERYGLALDIAWRRVYGTEPDEKIADARFAEMLKGVNVALCCELRDLGCPPAEIGSYFAVVVKRVAKSGAIVSPPSRC